MSAIFVSHSNENAEVARLLLAQLRRRGFDSVFLDFDKEKGILPGEGWEAVLYRRIRACQAMIALVSQPWLASDWCKTEIRQAKALGKPIFPVRLDDSDLSILAEFQFADLRGDKVRDSGAYDSLLTALEKARVSKGAWDGKRAPYPGLVSFEEEDAGVFFGREKEIHEAGDRLNALFEKGCPRWLVMIGASGSGKSSLVRAGLVPALRSDERHRWIVVGPFRRGRDPFDSAALALAGAFRRLGFARDAANLREILVAAEPAPLADLARELRLAGENSDAAALIVVDQFEELLTARMPVVAQDAKDRVVSAEAACSEQDAGFLALLRKLTELDGAPFFVLGTLRADFLGAFQSNPALRGLQSAELVVKPLDLAQMPRVIQEPAVLASVAFEEGLVDGIVRDTVTQDALPLLAFTLRELYDRHCQAGFVERKHYHELGGLQEAVAKRAEEVFTNLQLAPADETELRAAFLSLVQPTDDGQVVRRRVYWKETRKSIHPKLEEFVKARLLVSSEGDGSEPVLEVAHEALFRSWKRLADWIAQSREFLAWRKRLDPGVQRWERSSRAKGELLHRPELGEAESWLKKEVRLLSPSEREFIQASISAEHRRKWLVRISVASAMLVLLTASGVALLQKRHADAEAVRARNLALLSVGIRSEDPSIRAAILREVPSRAPPGWVAAAAATSWTAKASSVLKGHAGEVTSVAFGPDGKKVLTGSEDRTARVWNADGTGQPIELKGHTGSVWSVAFSPDGKKVVTGSSDNTARVWNSDGTGQPIELKGHTSIVASVAFSPDGKKVLTGSWDNTARVWNADGTGDAIELKGHTDDVRSVAFSPDGKKVLTGSMDSAARVWNADGTGQPIVLKGHTDQVLSVAFGPDGNKVLTGSMDGTARVWNADGTGQPIELKGHAATVVSVAFSPDGKKVVTGSGDNTARVWNSDGTGQPIELKGHTGWVSSVAFSPDGKKVLTGSMDSAARVWNADGTGQPIELKGHTEWVLSVAFSPDGKKVLTGSDDKTARVWNADGTGQPIELKGHTERVWSVAFSPDGKKVLTGSDDTARVCSPDGTGQPIELKGHSDAVSSVAFSPDGKKVLTGSNDKTARVWNADGTGQPIELKGHAKWVTSVAFSPDGKKVLTGSWDNTARVWNADGTGQPIELKGHTDAVWSVAFSPDGKKVLTGSWDNTARIWNVDGMGQPIELKGHTDDVRSVAFSPDGKKVLTGSWDKTARVWTVDPVDLRTLLWRQTQFCLDREQRSTLLGETETAAAKGYSRCRDTVERCLVGFDACQQAVARVYDRP